MICQEVSEKNFLSEENFKKFIEKHSKICLKFINILPIDKYKKNDILYPRGVYILA